jgi:DNA repair protein RecN (Recombination protein N)
MEAELDSGILEQFWDWLWSVRTELEEKLEGIDIPDELPEIVWRIERLARKAGVYPDELSEFLVQEKSNRTELEQLKEGIESRSRELRNLKARFWELAHILRAERRKVAEELSHRINQYLSFLFSSNITFKPEVLPVNTIDFRLGSDVYFYILRSGQKVKPEEVFSSGELSRFVLALYLASGVVAPVLVFDEIDAGVSGDTAKKVAELLRQMGQKGQVIVATHSHFVAAAADVQFSWRDGYWVRLSNDQRVEEIARLIGSSPKAARELIQYFKGKG